MCEMAWGCCSASACSVSIQTATRSVASKSSYISLCTEPVPEPYASCHLCRQPQGGRVHRQGLQQRGGQGQCSQERVCTAGAAQVGHLHQAAARLWWMQLVCSPTALHACPPRCLPVPWACCVHDTLAACLLNLLSGTTDHMPAPMCPAGMSWPQPSSCWQASCGRLQMC